MASQMTVGDQKILAVRSWSGKVKGPVCNCRERGKGTGAVQERCSFSSNHEAALSGFRLNGAPGTKLSRA